jgi:hypothetical protein
VVSARFVNITDELAATLLISPQAVAEAEQRGLLSFRTHRNQACWRLGDANNGCLRRLDGQPFEINGERVKAESETSGDTWHRLIGLDDIVRNARRDVLLVVEGSKDALTALHFADAEDSLSRVGVVAALSASVNPFTEDLEKFPRLKI